MKIMNLLSTLMGLDTYAKDGGKDMFPRASATGDGIPDRFLQQCATRIKIQHPTNLLALKLTLSISPFFD